MVDKNISMVGFDITSKIRKSPKTLVVLTPETDNDTLIRFAKHLSKSEPVLLIGIVPVSETENLSEAATLASGLRTLINHQVDRVNLRAKSRIRVTYTAWEDIRLTITEEPDIDLLILGWPESLAALRLTAAELLSHPPCDVALLRGPLPEKIEKILVPNLGDPHAERALRLSFALHRSLQTEITSLHIKPPDTWDNLSRGFSAMERIVSELPETKTKTLFSSDQAKTILDLSAEFDLIVMGTKAKPTEETNSFGKITDSVLRDSHTPVLAVKTQKVVPNPEGYGTGVISVLVDKWFAENTYYADEFSDLSQLIALKNERGVSISLALPALNEEETVGDILRSTQRVLMEQVPLLDEIILMDSNSTDRTREIACELGIPVYIHQELLPAYGSRQGKGEALWKSLFVTSGDIIIWVDTDIRNFHPRFVYGLIGPLLLNPKLRFVKGFYRRPLRSSGGLRPGRGGRVTELTARPLLNLFYPELSGVIQPLAGEYGGRREALEQLRFSSGYGVETGLLIDMFEKFGLNAIGQVDLVERIHRNQSLVNLSKMSFAIIQTFFKKLENRYGLAMLEDVNRTMKIVNYKAGHYYLNVDEIAELDRPPIVDIQEYQEKRRSNLIEEAEV